MSDFSRVTGLVSNFDTDGIVKSMVKAEKIKVDRVKAKAQLLEWKQEGYREVSSMLKGFQSKYFDLLNKESNLRFSSTYSTYKSKIMVNGEKNTDVSAIIHGSASFEKIEVDEITQLAKAETWQASKKLKEISGEVDMDTFNVAISGSSEAKKFSLEVDGVKKTINFKDSYSNLEDLRSDIQNKLSSVFGNNMINVTTDGGKLKIDGKAHKIEVESIDEVVGTLMGIKSGDKNYFDSKETLDSLLQIHNDVKIELQGADGKVKEVTIKSKSTIEEAKEAINSLGVGTLILDGVSGKFRLESNKTGQMNGITMVNDDTKKFFSKLGIDDSVREMGKNANVVVNGETITLSENTLRLDGIDINFNRIHSASQGKIEITKEFEIGDLADKFKGFIQKYNEMVDKLHTQINEKKSLKYKPLSDEEKKAMEKEDIEKWEKEAKSGLFRGDDVLEKILSDMRKVFTTKVEGVNITMRDLGIDFTKDYRDGGKLTFDQGKFEEAFKNKGSEAIKLFTSKSDKNWDTEDAQERFNESGIMERLNDIVKYKTSTTKLRSGFRGDLIEKAGVKGLSSENTAELSKKIREINKRVDKMMDTLLDKENKYYLKFARLERALAQISSQSSAFAGLMGGQ